MGQIKIRNKTTGKVKIIDSSELPQYGLPARQETTIPSAQMADYGTQPAMSLLQRLATSEWLPLGAGMLGGAAAAPLTGGVGAVPAAGLSAGAMYALQDLLRPYVGLPATPPKQALGEAGETTAKMMAAEAGGQLVTAAGTKLLGKAIPKIKTLRLPGGIQKSIQEAMTKVGDDIGKILAKASDKTIKAGPIIKELNKLRAREALKNVPQVLDKIDDVIHRVTMAGTNLTPQQANAIKTGFWQDIYGEAGKELTKRGVVGMGEKTAKEIAAGRLGTEVTEKVSQARIPMETFSQLGKLGTEMGRPLKNWWMGGLAGTLLGSASMMGAPIGMGMAGLGGLGTTLAAMPYTRLILQSLLGRGLQAGGRLAATPALYGLLGLPSD